MLVKASLGALLSIIVLIGCAAPARFSAPARTNEASLGTTGIVRQARTTGQGQDVGAGGFPALAGLPDFSAAGVADATVALPAVRLAGLSQMPSRRPGEDL